MNRKPFLVALAELIAAYRPHLNLRRPHWASWLPTRGNVLFTLVMIALLVAAQTVGALPLGRPQAAPSTTSTGTIAYQGRLADANGNPLTGTYNMIFRLYDAATGGTPLWSEQWTGSNGVKVSDGLFNVMLGSLTPLPISQFTNYPSLYLGITVGTDDEMAPRVQLGSVPFAVQALTVPDGSVTTGKIADGAVTQAKLGADVSLTPPDGSITTAKLADGAVTQSKAPTLLASMSDTGVKVHHGRDRISITSNQGFLSKTIRLTSVCTSARPLVFVQPHYNYYAEVDVTIGDPWDGGQFTIWLTRPGGWANGTFQDFDWLAICSPGGMP